jgi:hypothetical protein
VVTFLGWMCWLLNVGLAGKEFVTLNMDNKSEPGAYYEERHGAKQAGDST